MERYLREDGDGGGIEEGKENYAKNVQLVNGSRPGYTYTDPYYKENER